ncbi:MAG: hypothetical protein M1830_000445 [Pleopsidium flavum]|nr:MAG: hypothetical protein M1830_000445 [Pleopsidium flavum]
MPVGGLPQNRPSDGDPTVTMIASRPSNLKRINSRQSRHLRFNEEDVDQRIEVERGDLTPTSGSISPGSKTIISFSHGDPENPINWSTRKKTVVILVGVVTVINSTLGSALPGGATQYLASYFHITSQEQLVLPISMYLVGYVFGPLLFGPLSETYGRKRIMMWTFSLFTIFTLACAVAPTWPTLLIFRLIVGIGAACPVSVVGGLYADILNDPVERGRAISMFMAATTFGPLLGPIISGFVSVVGWRWTFWVGFIIAGVSFIPLLFLPETYGPVILQKRAQRMRKETGNPNIFAPIELEKKGVKQMMTVTLTRPVRMILFEAIHILSSSKASFLDPLFNVEADRLTGIYGMSTGVSALPFIPIGIGAIIACGIFIYYDSILQRAKSRNAHWSTIEENRRLPLACLGGPLYVISLFWLGWSASPHIHWIVPTLAGLPFGIGFLLIFMALINYLTDAYEIFAASALAAASCARAVFGVVLPLAAKPMYDRLGVNWASSLLGFLSLGMTVIPFAFIRYGDRIRANSKFCQYLLERKMEMEESMASQEPGRSSGEELVGGEKS